jgi:hypothetical protein
LTTLFHSGGQKVVFNHFKKSWSKLKKIVVKAFGLCDSLRYITDTDSHTLFTWSMAGAELFLIGLIPMILFATILSNLSTLQSPAVWDSMYYTKYLIFVLLGLGTLISFSYSIPAGICRRLVPWLGQVYVPLTIIALFWCVEMSLWIWSVRFYADTLDGNISFVSWFFYGFTPILSIGCLGGGFGAVMIAFTFPAWIVGCSALGMVYYYVAAAGQGHICVAGSCALKVALLLLAPSKGFLGGQMLPKREL